MLIIGEFSKLSRVSIRMLRHYDDIGLLKPAEIDQFTGYRYYSPEQLEIDQFTGYRYYSPEQLPVIGRITALKDMGFSLADIVKMLEIYENRDELDDYLMKRQLELQEISETTQRQMRLLDTARERLRKEQNMSYNVSIKTIPERYAATVHMTIPHYEDEGMLWNTMMSECKDLVPADPCLAAAEFLMWLWYRSKCRFELFFVPIILSLVLLFGCLLFCSLYPLPLFCFR